MSTTAVAVRPNPTPTSSTWVRQRLQPEGGGDTVTWQDRAAALVTGPYSLQRQLAALINPVGGWRGCSNVGDMRALSHQIRSGSITPGELLTEFQNRRFGIDRIDHDFVDGLLHSHASWARQDALIERRGDSSLYENVPVKTSAIMDICSKLDELGIDLKDKVFYDIGSGCGKAVMLMALLTRVRSARGVELEKKYHDQASDTAQRLNLKHVEFINGDARKLDYSDGDVFFFFCPFTGGVLDDVLENLHGVAQSKPITVIWLEPGSDQVASQPWLEQKFHGTLDWSVRIFQSKA